jgi:hypothetical protein
MTFRVFDASIIVGAIVVASIGSTDAAKTLSSSRKRVRAASGEGTSPNTVVKNLTVSGSRCVSGASAASLSMRRAALTRALSAIDGSEAWPLRPWTRRRNGELIFSPVAHM